MKLDSSLGEQSYKVSVGQKIVVTGGDAAGAFYGLTNLLQMFEKNSLQDVTNTPLVAERSAYIDCGRVYFSPEMLKALIKTLAWNRMNTLYLDFSNNNATRFFLDEMKVTAGGRNYDITTARPSDGKYLTQADMVDIIKVAKQYGVKIIPTFNSPGHIGGLYSLNNDLFDKGTATDYDSSCGKVTLLIENKNAYDFGQAVVKLYVDFFAQQGCESFNIAADEATLGNVKYDSDNETFVKYVNDLNSYIESKGMTTRMFNDGIQSVNSNISKNIIVLYWAPEGTAEKLHENGYQVVNFSYGAGLYFAYGASWWVWNQPVNTIYDGWTPGVLNRNTDYQYSYVATETTDPSNLLGATFAVWTDYAFTQSVSGDEIITRNSNDVVEKIQVVGDRCWENASTANYTTWKSGLTTAPGGINVSTYAIDGTVLPAASGITAASQVKILVEDANTGVSVAVKGEKGQTGSLTVDKLETSPNADAITAAGAEKSVSYNVTPAVDGKAYTGEGTVTLPVPEGWATEDSRIHAYIIDNGAVKLISGTLSGGKYTFQVPHFSEMGLVQLAEGAGSTKMITVAVGRTVKETLQGNQTTISGNYSEFVTVTAEHKTTTAEKKLLDITSASDLVSGAQYLIANQRHGGLLTGVASSDWDNQYVGLKLSGEASSGNNTNLWTITQSGSAYTAQYKGSNYLTIGENVATVSGSNTSTINLAYNNDGYWTISQNGYYLNHLGTSNTAGGWKDNAAATDEGSRWTIYRIVDEGATDTTTVSFTGKKVGGPVTVTVGDTTYSVTVVEKQNVEIPITIIDYRADGLLFDWNYLQGDYSDSYRYGLVHGKSGGYGYVVATKDSTTGFYTVDGNDSAVEQIAGTKIEQTGPVNSTYGTTFYTGNLDNSWSRAGLVQEKLGANGMPVYTDAAVKYVASLLKAGYYNKMSGNCNSLIYNTFVASNGSRTIRNTSASGFSENFKNAKTYANISNAYDLAWYLLNTIYQADTNMTTVAGTDGQTHSVPIYGMAVDAYKSIVLTDNGTGTYSFEAGYSNNPKYVDYDRTNGTISQGTGGTATVGFYPLDKLGYEQSGLLTKTSAIDATHNGSFTLRGESQFVYNEASNLYFQFTGDDDVYMYINGVLALDLGGAHGRNSKTVNLNDLDPTKYGLKEGQVATFTFFYMERCSDASTFGIETNMELVQRAINVEKKAYDTSYANEYASGTAVINGTTVAYDLIVTNKSNSPMSQIKLTDTDSLGGNVTIGSGAPVTPDVTPGTPDKDKGTVALGQGNGYVLFITDSTGTEVANTRKSLSSLQALSDEIAGLTLPAGQSLHVRFLTATTKINASKILDYINTVEVRATVGGKALSDTASHELYSYNANDTGRTYVVDFGLPLEITGIFDEGARDNIGEVSLSPKNEQKYGTVTIAPSDFGTTLTYTLKANTTINEPETITLDVVYNIGNSNIKLEKTLTIIPASNVYYEDSLATFKDGSGAAQNAVWSTVGNDGNAATEKTGVYQALQELGKGNNRTPYGYDDKYNKENSSMLSMGTAHKVTVTADMLAKWDDTTSAWPTAQFTFKGTGFDIISLTDNTSGAIVVDVYNGNSTDDQNLKDSYLVNNYYGYKQDENGNWVVAAEKDKNALYQIPVMKVTGLDYGEYTAVIRVFYNSFFDKNYSEENNNNQYSFWLDAVRIYDPMGEYAGYTADNEGYPQYIKLRDELAKTAETNKGVVFIDGAANASIADYANFGPNNEVYLANGQAISFKVPENDKIASIQIGAKAPKGTANLNVNEKEIVSGGLSTATEMYYDITTQVTGGSSQVTITNTTGNILSLTNLKITFNDKNHKEVTLEEMTAKEQANAVAMVQALFTAPVATFSPETFQADWGRAVRAGKRATLTVKTSADVESITVDGQSITGYTTRTQRTGWGWWSPKVTYHVFTYTTTAPAQTTDYAVCAVNAEGTASEAVTATLTVKPTTWWNWWF